MFDVTFPPGCIFCIQYSSRLHRRTFSFVLPMLSIKLHDRLGCCLILCWRELLVCTRRFMLRIPRFQQFMPTLSPYCASMVLGLLCKKCSSHNGTHFSVRVELFPIQNPSPFLRFLLRRSPAQCPMIPRAIKWMLCLKLKRW